MNQQHPTLPAPRSPKTARSTDRGVFATRRPSLQAGPQTYRIATHVASDSASTVELKDHADAPRAAWDGYERDVLPRKLQPKVLRNLRNQLLSLYRRLFGLVFVANLGLFVAVLARGGATSLHLGLITIANLFCAILLRNEYVINALFSIFCAVPAS
jgi:hypothetical protein